MSTASAPSSTTASEDFTAFWGEPIHVYTRAQAIADGTLIDASATAREQGIQWPVAFTVAAWADLVAWDDNTKPDACQDENGRLWDVLTIIRWGMIRPVIEQAQQAGTGRVENHVLRVPVTGRTLAPRKAPFALGLSMDETGQPVLTVMTTTED